MVKSVSELVTHLLQKQLDSFERIFFQNNLFFSKNTSFLDATKMVEIHFHDELKKKDDKKCSFFSHTHRYALQHKSLTKIKTFNTFLAFKAGLLKSEDNHIEQE